MNKMLYLINSSVSNNTIILMLIIFLWCLSVLIKWVNQRRHFLKLASLLPGPPTVPILGNLLMIATRPQEVIGIVKEWNYTYNRGPFRVWLCHKLAVILSKPSDIEAILGNVKQFSKSQQYDVLRSLMGDGLFTSKNHNSWKSNRKLVTPAFHFTILKGFLSIFYQEASILADKINSRVGECTDVYPYVALCTLDAICRTAMGVSVKAQHGNGGDFVKNLETVFKVWQQRMVQIWLQIPILFSLSNIKKVHDEAVKSTLQFTEKVIKEKHEEWEMSKDEYYKKLEDGGKLAFLDLMLGNGMTDNELRDETMTIIIGGQETTATELSFALLLIAMHPDVQELVHEELDYIFGNDKYTEPGLYDLNKLEYLERVIKETMRLFPALPAIGRQLEEDVKVGDFVVPKGTDIGIFIYETHRDPDHWKDPGKFNPDNFLPENCRTRHPYSYMPFSAGLRNCIGQKYGMLQMKTVLSTLLRRYNIQPGPEHSTVDKIDVIMTTTLKSKKGFNVIFNLR